MLEGDSAEEAAAKLDEAVAALLPQAEDAAWMIGHLRPLLGLEGDVRAGAEGRGETFAAWRRFLEAVAEHRPDRARLRGPPLGRRRASRLRRRARRPSVGCTAARRLQCAPRAADEKTRVGRREGERGDALAVARSRTRTPTRLIGELLAQAVLPAEMQQTLIRRAEGNPLFAEEYVRMLRDRGLCVATATSGGSSGRGRRSRDGPGHHRRPARCIVGGGEEAAPGRGRGREGVLARSGWPRSPS